FDNALDNNPDVCNHAYKTTVNSKFTGFEFQVNAPMISLVFKERKHVNLKADFNYVNVRDLAKSGFISSPGFNGCDKLGGDQVHQSKQYRYSEDYDMHGEPDQFRILFDGDMELADGTVVIKDITNNFHMQMTGWKANTKFTTNTTSLVIVAIDNINITAGDSFMLRFTSTQILNETTPAPEETVTNTSPADSPITASTSPRTSPVTTTVTTPTTSSAGGITG
ncbi:hypothetical protein PENTCL1PPCAC_20212, partial [Pristionchus entomophagus]